MKEIHYRFLTVLVLSLATPFIKKIIILIYNFQLMTLKFFRQLGPVIQKQMGIQIYPYLMDLLACVFWPLLLTILVDVYYKFVKHTEFKSPNLLLLFLWLVFNGGTLLLRQGTA